MRAFHHHNHYRPATIHTVAPGYHQTHVIRSISRLRPHPFRQIQRQARTVFVFLVGVFVGVLALAMVLHP